MDRSRSPAPLHGGNGHGNGQASPEYSPPGMGVERGAASLGAAQSKFMPAPKLPSGGLPGPGAGPPDMGQPMLQPRAKSGPPPGQDWNAAMHHTGMQGDSLQSILHSGMGQQNDMQGGMNQGGMSPSGGLRPSAMQSNPFQHQQQQPQNMMQQNMMQQKMPQNMMHPGMRHPGMRPNMRHPGMRQQQMMQGGMMQPNTMQQNPMQKNYYGQGGPMQQTMMQQGGMQPGMLPQSMAQQGMMQPGMGMGQSNLQQDGGVGQPGMGQYGQGQYGMGGGQPNMGHLAGTQPGLSHQGLGMGIPQHGMGQGPCLSQPNLPQPNLMQGNLGQMGLGQGQGQGGQGQTGLAQGQPNSAGAAMQPPGSQGPPSSGLGQGPLFKMPPPSGPPPPPPPQQPPPPPNHPPPLPSQPPPPPDQHMPPPSQPASAMEDESARGNGHDAPGEFRARLEELQKQFPGIEVPSDSWMWTVQELTAFFESGGSEHPRAEERKTVTPKKRDSSGQVLEYEVSDALQLQAQLRDGFQDAQFQDALKRLQRRYPERKRKGHSDGAAYFEAFEALTLSVHARVLPTWGMTADWDGVREMTSRMAKALKHPKVRKSQEEINVLMGLPRNATFTPPRKGEELFLYRPNADGPVPGYPRDLVYDEDGDEGHEFFVEDRETGGLRPHGPTALDTECWYQVVHRPAVVIREQPDEKSKMVGRKKTGKRVRVQRIVGGKWLQLHHSELVRLGVQEAWVLLDGAELGLNGQQLLERVL